MDYGYDIIGQDDWYYRDPITDKYIRPFESMEHAGAAESWCYA